MVNVFFFSFMYINEVNGFLKKPSNVFFDYIRQPVHLTLSFYLGNVIYVKVQQNWNLVSKKFSVYLFLLDSFLLPFLVDLSYLSHNRDFGPFSHEVFLTSSIGTV